MPQSPVSEDLGTRLTGLRQRVQEADRLRAQAETTHQMAQKRLAEIDAEIRKLGIDPEQAEQQLAVIEANLAKELDALDRTLVDEVAAYRKILEAGQ